MEESKLEESVRARLILAGLDELHEHGVADFSLRRVAITAQVSCAAPYRHFKDKGELIKAIIEYIASKWELLCREIESAFGEDKKRLVIELCVCALRFWIANGSFRTVLMTADEDFAQSLEQFDIPIDKALISYFEGVGNSEKARESVYTVRTLIYGTVLLITQGRLTPDVKTVNMMKNRIEALIS